MNHVSQLFTVLIILMFFGGCGAPQSTMRPISLVTLQSKSVNQFVAQLKADISKGNIKAFQNDLQMLLGRLDLEKNLDKLQPGFPELFWFVAKVCGDLALQLSNKKHKAYFLEQGIRYARLEIKYRPKAVQGHYYLAANLGLLAELKNEMKQIAQIVKLGEIVIAIDPNYDAAGGYRFLGMLYYRAPAWPASVGDIEKSLQYLKKAYQIAPTHPLNSLFLAEVFLKEGKRMQARQQVIMAQQLFGKAEWQELWQLWRDSFQKLKKQIFQKRLSAE